MSRILLLEDDEALGRGICMALETPNCTVTHCSTRLQAIKILQGVVFDLLILDINLPDGSGLELLRTLRQNGTSTPAILLTANDLELDEVTGLEAGADDYITKPFNNREVIARVKAVLRRSSAVKKDEAGGRSHIEYRGLSIDMEKYQVIAFGKKMTFTAKEMELLWCLASNPGKAFSRNQLLETIWGYSYYGDTRTVDTHIKRIRQKLNIPSDSDWDITTIWGVGYKFEVKDKK